jgi:hypothetical protein
VIVQPWHATVLSSQLRRMQYLEQPVGDDESSWQGSQWGVHTSPGSASKRWLWKLVCCTGGEAPAKESPTGARYKYRGAG